MLVRVPVLAALIALLALGEVAARSHLVSPLQGAPVVRTARGHPSSRRDPGLKPTRAVITIAAPGTGIALPSSFLGFSTEYSALGVDERHIGAYRRLVALVHPPGDGRFLLRIGGDSSDHAFWAPALRDLPHWGIRLTPGWSAGTARMVRESGLRVIIDLNLVTGTPQLAAVWAHQAESELPRRSILGFEIGNEPDFYQRPLWTLEVGHSDFAADALPRAITPTTYARAYRLYARALATAAPRAGLLGPVLGAPRSHRAWVATLLRGPHPGLAAISVHQYPYTACALPRARNYPTIPRLLSNQATAGMAAAVEPDVVLARRESLPVRVTEFNSVTCGGLAGVSNTFATALWAPDALFELARAGVLSADLHVRVFSSNTPFVFDAHGVRLRPLFYGLVLFARMLGPGSRLIPLHLRAAASADLKAWAVSGRGNRLKVLVIDKGTRPADVNLRLPGSGPATVQRLLAPSASSTAGVTLDGQRLDDSARWRGRRTTQRVRARAGDYPIAVRGLSAAIVSVRAAPGITAR